MTIQNNYYVCVAVMSIYKISQITGVPNICMVKGHYTHWAGEPQLLLRGLYTFDCKFLRGWRATKTGILMGTMRQFRGVHIKIRIMSLGAALSDNVKIVKV